MRFPAVNCLALFLLGVLTLTAANQIAGIWTGRMHMGGGGAESPVDTTFTVQVDSAKLTGTVSSSRGTFDIQDGKVAGDSLTFTLEVPDARILFDGRMTEEGIDFIAEIKGRGRSDQFIAKRARE